MVHPFPGSRLRILGSAIALLGFCFYGGVVLDAQSALPHNIPDFSQDGSHPTLHSAQSGSWASPSTWVGGQLPTANHVVNVDPGHTVRIDTTGAEAYTLAVHGILRFDPSVNTRLKVTNLMIMGDHGMATMTQVGYLEVGTAATPVAAGVTAEIVIANSPLGGGVADPEGFGTGIINFGKLTMHGSLMSPTFLRLATEPRAGQTTLTLSAAVSGWRVGDRLVIPDTRHMKESETTSGGWMNAQNQWEELSVQAVSADGKTITLSSALRYDHLGARDLNGVLDFLPHVGNLSRNVIIRSENPAGTRGHLISVHTADTDIRYVGFKDLGRTKYTPLNTTTNLIGRYPIHMHHNRGPVQAPANGYQFTLVGNAVDGGSAETQFKWGITVHDSHYGLIQDNVVYNYNGSSIATEDGSESFNVFDHNFALRGIGEPNDSVNEARSAMGTEGVGFWFRGPNNYVRNNVAANFQNPTTEAAYGFVYQLIRLGNVATPNFKGADTTVAGQFTTRNGNNMPILQFENNEAYGAMQGGFTYWWVNSQDPQPYASAQDSIIKNLKIWHVYNKAVYHYPAQKIVFDGLIIRGNFSSASRCCGNGIYGADYSTKGIVVRNSDIQGMDEGIAFPESGFGPEPNLTVENSYLRNDNNIQIPTNGSVNGCWMQNKLVVISNTRFAAPTGRSLNNIAMVRDVGYAPECLSKLDEARVYAYNGVATDNFQIYHSNTSVLPRPPASCTPTTRAGISGLLCPIAALGAVIPTVTLAASPTSITSGQASTLTWSTTNATTVTIDQGIGAVAVSGTRSVSPLATTVYTVTATNSAGSATATATVSVAATIPVPTATFTASPTSIVAGGSSTLTWATTNAATVSINQTIGVVTASGTRSVSPTATTTYTLTATNATGSTTATATVTVTATTSPHNKDRANSYDDAWQDGTTGWVANAKAILAGGAGQVPGLVLWIGDSLTRDPALGTWAQAGAGKTAEDQMITSWIHAGLSPQGVDSVDGFALATPYICAARSFTVGDGLGSWNFMGSSMPTVTDPALAKQTLLNCSSYSNALNLTTMLNGLQKAQFAIPEVNLDAANPSAFPDFERMVDLLIARHIVPIIITYTYRTDAAFNLMVDQYNTALIQYAQSKKLPLIDFNKEMLARLPFSQWPGRFLSDGVHYTHGTTTYPATSDPYANGGDPATHTTGIALTYNGYGLKGWLGVQKLKEIKQLAVDGVAPPTPTATLTASPTSIVAGGASTLTWTTTNAATVSIDQGIGTVAASGSRSVSPAATTTYTLTATNATASATASATVTVTPVITDPPPSGPGIVGSQVAGSFGDATGHSGQSHLVYAANAGVWWLFSLTSTADSQGGSNHVIKSYRSSGADLATATWSPGPDSPGAAVSAGYAPSASMGSGRALAVAYVNNNPTDVLHAEINMSFDGQDSITSHMRAVLTATTVAWAGWNYVVEPNATWASPRATALGVSSGKYIHSAGPNLQQEIDANARKSTNADTGSAWASGFTSVSVIDNSMINQVNSVAFAPLASNMMLAVYDNGGGQSCGYNCVPPGSATEPSMTNLGYRRSNSNGSWPGVAVGSQASGDGSVFGTAAIINQNDWTLVPVSGSTIHAFRAKASGAGIDGASYNVAGNTWSAMGLQPPALPSGQGFKAGAGLFGATDGTQVWLFYISTDAANSIRYSRYDGSSWSAWAAVPGTNLGTHTRNFLAGSPVVGNSQVGLIWTEGAAPYSIGAASLAVTAAVPPLPTATLTLSPASIALGATATLSWSTANATTVTIDHGVGTVAASGTTSVSPTATTTYTLTALNAAGPVTATATVTVTAPPPPPPLPTATLTATPGTIASGGTATLTWSTTNATSININQGVGNVSASGTTSVSPTATTTYTLTATNAAGSTVATASVTVSPTTSGDAFASIGLTAGWATFGQAVPQGVATTGLAVGNLATQTDVKNRWPDGSIRFAIVTVLVPTNGTYPMSAGTTNSGSFAPGPVDAAVVLTIGSATYTAMLPAGVSSDVWLSGRLVREDRQVIAPVTSTGSAHPFLRVNFDRRVFNDGQARVDVSVENMLDKTGATTVTYDVVVWVNGQAVFSTAAVQHYYLTRWRKLFQVGSTAMSEVTPDLAPFNQSRALPPYLPLVTNVVSTPTGSSYDILKPGALIANMPDHGGRPELAP
ncbi:MAG: G8 domain-containing protein, partial [Vicinamibacterales bacterium]